MKTYLEKAIEDISYNELLSDSKVKEFLEVYANVVAGYYEDVDKDEAIKILKQEISELEEIKLQYISCYSEEENCMNTIEIANSGMIDLDIESFDK